MIEIIPIGTRRRVSPRAPRIPPLGRRGSVAVWIAVMLPGLIMALSLGIEVSTWAASQVSLQRTADIAASAGMATYASATGSGIANGTALTLAMGYANNVAQMNGIPGNQVTIASASGQQDGGHQALQVTLRKPVAAIVSGVFDSTTTRTVQATSKAELVTLIGAGSGGQPCLVALFTNGVVTGSGSTNLTMPNCTIRSNGTISFSGSGTLQTAGIYAAGAISIPTWFTITGAQVPNKGLITDPYASYTPLQAALTATAALRNQANITCGSVQGVYGTAGQYTGGNNCNGTNTLPNNGTCVTNGGVTCTLYPGNYGSFTISGGPYTFNLQPGLYQFSGAISLTNNSTTNGTGGVTIITAGTFTGSNSFNFNITAPNVSQAASTGGVPGVALASAASGTVALSGAVAFNVSGIVYTPNATFDASGSSGNPGMGSSGNNCLEIIAGSIKLSGSSYFNSVCSALGATTFTSVGGTITSTAQLVQ